MEKKTHLLKNLLSFFYPDLCISCHHALQQSETHLCLNCLIHLPETHYHLQPDNPIKTLFVGRVKVEQVASLLFYRKANQVQKILHSLKYKGNKEIGAYLGKYYGKQLHEVKEYQTIDLILPIPLHPKKEKKRGYNQSEWIAKGLSAGMKIPYTNDILVRTEFTETQTKKGRYNRWENVKDVFEVIHPEKITGKHILICDDVLTTGATMEAAIQKILSLDNNIKVSVVTLACAHN